MGVEITQVTDQDCHEVVAFLDTAMPEDWRLPEPPDDAQIQRVLSHPGSLFLAARQGDAIAGLALGWILPTAFGQGDTAMLDELLVSPDCRGRGIGTALTRAFRQSARRAGQAPVEIWAATDVPTEPAATPFARSGGIRGELFRQFDWPREAPA
ncbi:GNAT family N-acetyltransferase [Pseudaestuariivita sp.]|uniref:GNAT family N-acetyltransferase n=1 Tax=Pseudaestuariivita sp. TaxID=2211669 RepID=UPI00405A38BB